MHVIENLYKPKPWLIALVLEPFIVPLKADPQAPACFSEYHDNDHSLMPTKDVRSDDYAPGTTSSGECAHPTDVGSRNGQPFPLLIMTNDNDNIIAMLCEVSTLTLIQRSVVALRTFNLPQ